jgi:hypothetical protein
MLTESSHKQNGCETLPCLPEPQVTACGAGTGTARPIDYGKAICPAG